MMSEMDTTVITVFSAEGNLICGVTWPEARDNLVDAFPALGIDDHLTVTAEGLLLAAFGDRAA